MELFPFTGFFPTPGSFEPSTSFFESLREAFPTHFRKEIFFHRPSPGLFIYRIETPKRRHTGLLACTDILSYMDGEINRHELTLSLREETQVDLILKRGASVKPVLLTYANIQALDDILQAFTLENAPFQELKISDEDQLHQFWEITDPALIRLISDLFNEANPRVVIADGHHRSEAQALLYQRFADQGQLDTPFRYLLSAYFPVSELDIWSFNRLVEIPQGVTAGQLIEKLGLFFDLTPSPLEAPRKKGEIIIFGEGFTYLGRWREDLMSRVAHTREIVLDADLLNELIFTDLIGIRDVRNDARIQYVEGIKGIEGLKKGLEKRPGSIGFWLYPVDIDDLMTLSVIGESLPPKSTWFEPRMKNGMIVQVF
ncbi:MAG: DUF1015 domain-containing protein [Lewinellaceae bacterium]|nr:DUF1015 domain-containing protein [Lewinella sp.]MCB9280008.1 DUF1015 domain-containing protein [Lewinellaceae bacterium]